MNLSDVFKLKLVSFYPHLRHLTGSIQGAILLQQLLYWWSRKEGKLLYKTIDQIELETSLTRHEQQSAIKRLVACGFISVIRKGENGKRNFCVYEDVIHQKMFELLQKMNEENETRISSTELDQKNTDNLCLPPSGKPVSSIENTQKGGAFTSRLPASGKPVCRETENGITAIRQTGLPPSDKPVCRETANPHTENTTEITTENSLSLVLGNLEDTSAEPEPVAARERENNFSEKPSPSDQKTSRLVACIDDPPDRVVPELSPDGKFIEPDWLPIELWRQWLSVRPNPPLSAFGERTECKRLWAMVQQGWGMVDIFEDAIARAKPRLSAPCKPGDEKRILAERNRDNPAKTKPVPPDYKKSLIDLKCDLRTVSQDIKHLETLIGRAEGDSKQSLINQKNRAEGLVQEITTKIGRINLERGVIP